MNARVGCFAVALASALLVAEMAAGQAIVPPPRVTDMGAGPRTINDVENEAFRRLTLPGGQEVDREALANEVASLVDQGRCEEARNVARRAGDRGMARRVGQICREGQRAVREP